MALANYANLKASVQTWSKRQDVDDKLDDFIDLCETEIYSNAIAPLRIREMVQLETSATSTSVRTQALPTGFLEARRFDLTVSGQRPIIEYITPSAQVIRDSTGTPSNYTITDQIEYDIIPDVAYVTNISYYGKLTALSASNTTNALLTAYPNAYLYGSLMVLFQWADNTEEYNKYKGLFVEAISGANNTSAKGDRGVASQKRRAGRNP
jgi:hypothetical protein